VEQVASGQLQSIGRRLHPEVIEQALQRALRPTKSDPSMDFCLRTLKPGELLFREGENAEFAYLVKSGRLRAYKEHAGRIDVLGEIGPGEFVGEMAYIDGEPRTASVDSVETSELIELPLKNLDAIVFSKPAWSRALMKTMSKRIKGMMKKKAA
jgi:CRP-like cAMP-binding protein